MIRKWLLYFLLGIGCIGILLYYNATARIAIRRLYQSDVELVDEIVRPLGIHPSRDERDSNFYHLDQNGRIKRLAIRYTNLPSVDLSGLSELKNLQLWQCGISDLSLYNFPPNLEILQLGYNHELKTVDLSGLHKLKLLNLAGCNITDLSLSILPPQLKFLAFSSSDLKAVDVSGLLSLEDLVLSNCDITDLSLSKLPPQLKRLTLSGNRGLKSVDLSGFRSLLGLYLNQCGIADLSLSKFPPQLYELQLLDNPKLETVDLSGLPALNRLVLFKGRCLSDSELVKFRNN